MGNQTGGGEGCYGGMSSTQNFGILVISGQKMPSKALKTPKFKEMINHTPNVESRWAALREGQCPKLLQFLPSH